MNTGEIAGMAIKVGSAAGGGILVGRSFKSSFVEVPEQHLGFVLWRERVRKTQRNGLPGPFYGVRGPGKYKTRPFFGTIQSIFIGDRSNDLSEITFDRAEHRQYTVHSSIVWNVIHEAEAAYRAKFKTQNLEQAVTNTCVGGLRKVLHMVPEAEIGDEEVVFGELHSKVRRPLNRFGVQLTTLNLHEVRFSQGQMQRETGLLTVKHFKGQDGESTVPAAGQMAVDAVAGEHGSLDDGVVVYLHPEHDPA